MCSLFVTQCVVLIIQHFVHLCISLGAGELGLYPAVSFDHFHTHVVLGSWVLLCGLLVCKGADALYVRCIVSFLQYVYVYVTAVWCLQLQHDRMLNWAEMYQCRLMF